MAEASGPPTEGGEHPHAKHLGIEGSSTNSSDLTPHEDHADRSENEPMAKPGDENSNAKAKKKKKSKRIDDYLNGNPVGGATEADEGTALNLNRSRASRSRRSVGSNASTTVTEKTLFTTASGYSYEDTDDTIQRIALEFNLNPEALYHDTNNSHLSNSSVQSSLESGSMTFSERERVEAPLLKDSINTFGAGGAGGAGPRWAIPRRESELGQEMNRSAPNSPSHAEDMQNVSIGSWGNNGLQRSQSAFSNRSGSSGSQITKVQTPSRRESQLREDKRNKKKTGFIQNDVTKVTIYEVDNTLMIDIEYKRNRLGWLLLFLGFLADWGLSSFVCWVTLIKNTPRIIPIAELTHYQPTVSMYSVVFWATVWEFPVYIAVLVIMAMSDILKLSDFKPLLRQKTLLLSIGLGVAFYSTIFTQVLAGDYETVTMALPPEYLPTVNLCIWFLFAFRYLTKIQLFPQEFVGGFVAFVGYVIVSIPAYKYKSDDGKFWGLQGFLLLGGIALTLWFVAMEKLTAVSPGVVVSLLPSMFINLLFSLISGIAATAVGPDSDSSMPLIEVLGKRNFFSVFERDYLGYGIGGGILLVLVQMLYLSAARYLDVLSVAAAVAMKSTFLPYLLVYFVCFSGEFSKEIRTLWALSPGTDTPVVQDCPYLIWNPFLWGATPVVVIGCVGIVIFASVKRQFVNRRVIATAVGKKPRDPHNRHPERPKKEPLPVDENGIPIKPKATLPGGPGASNTKDSSRSLKSSELDSFRAPVE